MPKTEKQPVEDLEALLAEFTREAISAIVPRLGQQGQSLKLVALGRAVPPTAFGTMAYFILSQTSKRLDSG